MDCRGGSSSSKQGSRSNARDGAQPACTPFPLQSGRRQVMSPLFRRRVHRVAPLVLVSVLAASGSLELRGHSGGQSRSVADAVEVDVNASSHPFPHFWEKMFGSGRAILTLRESYRQDLRERERITGVEYVRFHAIFHDES